MKIIVDNGGTKSDWMVVDQNRHFSDIGINLFDTKKSIVSNFKSINYYFYNYKSLSLSLSFKSS